MPSFDPAAMQALYKGNAASGINKSSALRLVPRESVSDNMMKTLVEDSNSMQVKM